MISFFKIYTKYSESFSLAVKEKIQVRPRDGADCPNITLSY